MDSETRQFNLLISTPPIPTFLENIGHNTPLLIHVKSWHKYGIEKFKKLIQMPNTVMATQVLSSVVIDYKTL